ncbi:hypothetical protein [Burkholderia pseudomultivorans]|uniref:hypothetical protein n=1 Tax=Burkholderia pseudomultivorans TaxID=1207504 RepID=UPI000AE64363|nr:hypothetical protein [Burkholderia pseudomultivorans]
MYFAALKKAIQYLEEKRFYDVALMYLAQQGYQELSIVDGSGDGGRDVVCSRKDLRIQLSVRKDWAVKINEESETTRLAGKRHFIYITNRVIHYADEQAFLANSHKNKGEVEVTIHDLNRISTALAQPGSIQKAYSMLGMSVDTTLSAEPKDIALSTVLLFSKESHDFRANIIESNVRAWLLKNPNSPEERLVVEVARLLPGPQIDRDVRSAIGRLKTAGRVLGRSDNLSLSGAETEAMRAAEDEYLISTESDVNLISGKYGLNKEDARRLISLSLELVARERALNGYGAIEDTLTNFIAEKNLSRRRADLYEDLSKTAIVRIRQYGKAVEHIFSANTFDIYRALGRKTRIVMVLDSSVAMPMMFGLAFGSARSRYGVAATSLLNLCKEHELKIMVPTFYVNEMASHGLKALDFIETYNALPDEAKSVLRASGNAYLSHYSHIGESLRGTEDEITLDEFLRYFGIVDKNNITSAENKIASILESFNISVENHRSMDPVIRRKVADEKPNELSVIIDHDAKACTLLREDTDAGYIFATWDRVLTGLVENIARIFADTPARVIDFLSMAASAKYESDQSYELLTTLIHCDDQKAAALAAKIERIRSTEQVFRLQKFVDDARTRSGPGWKLDNENPDHLLQELDRADNA